ncbi:aspartyl-phosphate phosphatase Spo0E family protein [Neobacillus ginsengisoli]|uniref:Aspartyl-phosphate phosphatase Spo0E family protein n=1 Tax=Neobacillus ginsengisoli TaxID=904295 RepID=A0ABT9Y0R2_9BACI|nr:aspartyl-phosphate phosphatase Spo0E family protein [Neobacillus ginsengisoli]MDQ0201407.1 hypothetical protein [Neobacillus ginsengisoli]
MRLDRLKEKINEKREEMIKLGIEKGLINEETIYCSQELDELLNEYNRLLSEHQRTGPINKYIEVFLHLEKQAFNLLWMPYSYIINHM